MFSDHLPRLTLARAVALALLLLLAQALGLAHGVAHAKQAPAPGGQAFSAAGPMSLLAQLAPSPTGTDGGAVWGESHQAGDVECRLIDQLGHVDGAAPAPQACLPAPHVAQALPMLQAAAPRTQRAVGYLARGPPR